MIHARVDYQRIQDPADKIGADEPVMLFRAQDALAPAVLARYADLLRLAGARSLMIDTVLAHEARMRQWQRANGCKLPDMPDEAAGPPPSCYVPGMRLRYKNSAATVRMVRQTPSEILVEQDTGERSWVTLDAVEPAQ